jgi:hypothetical protein
MMMTPLFFYKDKFSEIVYPFYFNPSVSIVAPSLPYEFSPIDQLHPRVQGYRRSIVCTADWIDVQLAAAAKKLNA